MDASWSSKRGQLPAGDNEAKDQVALQTHEKVSALLIPKKSHYDAPLLTLKRRDSKGI
jgi:hypothetical protein